MTEILHFGVGMDKGLTFEDFDRKEIMNGLKGASKIVQQATKRLISQKRVSRPGELPGRNTGRMRRAVKIHNAKRKDRFWSRVQVDSIKGAPVWYPAMLAYGKKDGTLKPRKDPIEEAFRLNEVKVTDSIENAVIKGIKVFK